MKIRVKLVKELIREMNIKVKYFHNVPSLKQALNVNDMFAKAEGEFIVLLHDDDLLLPNALEDLYNCFVQNESIEVAFGKQYLMSESDVVDDKGSEVINNVFYRSG